MTSVKSSASNSTPRSRYVSTCLHAGRTRTFDSHFQSGCNRLVPLLLQYFHAHSAETERGTTYRGTAARGSLFLPDQNLRSHLCLCPVCLPVCLRPGADREIQSVRQLMVNILQNHTKLDWPDRCPTLGPYRYQNLSHFILFH